MVIPKSKELLLSHLVIKNRVQKGKSLMLRKRGLQKDLETVLDNYLVEN